MNGGGSKAISMVASLALVAGAALVLMFLFKASLSLAASRVYHPDECQNVFAARSVSANGPDEALPGKSLFLLPLSALVSGADQASKTFVSARLVAMLVFWLNCLLLVLATGEKLLSRRGLCVLLGAGTLAPLWEFGIEIRQENLLLTGLLLLWCVLRRPSVSLWPWALAGLIAALLEYVAWDSFVISFALAWAVGFGQSPSGAPAKRMLAWAATATSAFILVGLLWGWPATWQSIFVGRHSLITSGIVGETWEKLNRVLTECPLLLALALTQLGFTMRSRLKRDNADASFRPEVFGFAVLCVLAVIARGKPVLVLLIPWAFLSAWSVIVMPECWEQRSLRILLISLLFFGHFAPFGMALERESRWSNQRQENLMEWAEQLTDPAGDKVYDGAGMVPIRKSFSSNWLLLEPTDVQAKGEELVELFRTSPPAVIVRNCRTDWLPPTLQSWIREHYVPLGDDFLTLGIVVPRRGGEFQIIHPGRYRITPLGRSNILGTYPETLGELMQEASQEIDESGFEADLNNVAITNPVVDLRIGVYQIESHNDDQIAIVWVGPKLDDLPRVGRGDHRHLFIRDY